MAPESPWADSIPIPGVPTDSQEPALAATVNAIHAVSVSNHTLYHSFLIGGRWRGPWQLANGEQPGLAAGADGTVHCAFTHWFLGNCEIFLASWDGGSWSLPRLVSRTSGISTNPALGVGHDGGVYMVWADTTPGTSTIYYARPQGSAWSNGPIPSAPGSLPAIAVGPGGEIVAAWQDRLAETGRFEILAAILRNGTWSLPELVSDNPLHHSLHPALAVSPQGACHVVWQEERDGTYGIRHAERLPGGWSLPVDISDPRSDARLPSVAASSKGFLQVMWAEGPSLKHRARVAAPGSSWWAEEVACEACPRMSTLAIASSPASGELHAIWSVYGDSHQQSLYHAYRMPLIRHTVFIPIVAGRG